MRRDHADVAAQLISLSLTATKSQTMKAIYERIAPGDDGRIRTVLSPVGTETGRLASGETFLERSTNMQNMPKKVAKLDPLYNVRRCIIAAAGHALVEVDLSQAEVWATAAHAGDMDKLAALQRGDDLHRALAAKVFDIDAASVTKVQRDNVGKPGNHKLNYGAGWETFMEGINKDGDYTGFYMDAPLAKKTIAAWQAMNAATVAWWAAIWRQVQSNGCLVNSFGRRRDFLSPYVRPTDAYAYLPQSDIADLLNDIMCDIFEGSKELARWLALQIHDALLFEVPQDRVAEACVQLRCYMERPITINGITIIVPADISVGASWDAMEAA